jgi:hypothetical protein
MTVAKPILPHQLLIRWEQFLGYFSKILGLAQPLGMLLECIVKQ